MAKRLFDIVFSAIGLVALAPVFAAAAIVIKLDSRGPVFFRQERVGRNFNVFKIIKFRTMTHTPGGEGALITVSGDSRVTSAGRYLRKYKIDELPQLLNVLRGEMSLVGPRPEVMRYVRLFKAEYRKLLRVRPGITDPASIRFSEEEKVLAAGGDWEEVYVKRILPEKITLSLSYAENQSVFRDFKVVLQTLLRIKDSGVRSKLVIKD